MKNYVKPVVLDNDEMFEGVYTASGDGGDCYTATAKIHQTPEEGRQNYCIQVDAVHAAANGHHSGQQILTLYFNQPVTYDWCSSAYAQNHSGDGTSTLQIKYNYHANASENHGLGDIYVKSADGLVVNSIAKLECDYGVNDPNQDHLTMW